MAWLAIKINVRSRTYILLSEEQERFGAFVSVILHKDPRMSFAFAARRVVLIVEDDLLIRLNAAEIIEAAGFDVVEASNADEAIAILEVRPEIAVLFTDIQMPGSMDGLKLAAAVKGRWPPIKIVATSGLVNVQPDDLPEGGRFLPKPYNPNQLTATLRELTVDQ